jgi:hypothetical protein
MKRYILILIGLLAVGAWVSSEIWARGGRGGGGFGGGGGRAGGGFGGGGGGAGRVGGGYSAAGRTPSMSRPTQRPQMSRPSPGGIASSGSRPNINRPSMGKLPTPGARPSGGISTRPGGLQPGNIANRPVTRPGGDFRPTGGRPSAGNLEHFLDLPGAGGGGIERPGAGAVAGGAAGLLAGGAAAQFLHENPSPFPSRPGAGEIASTLPATRPNINGLRPGGGEGVRPGVGGEGTRPGRPGEGIRPGGGGENIRPGEGNRPNRPGQGGSGERWRPGDGTHNRPDRITDWNQWNNWRHDHHSNIINNWHNDWHEHSGWYARQWWNRRGWTNPYYPGFNYWAYAAWPSVMGWVNYGWTQPVYYSYGDNVYYQGDQVYYGDQPVATAAEYAEQAEAIAQNQPATKPAADDWMPLGVFAIAPDGKPTGADPTMYLQLAVSKQGVINGTFQDTATDEAKQVEGMVDKQTQRAAWTPVGKDRPIMETGIVNLTHDTAPALVHFADGSTQQWLLVRLDQPKDTEATPSE